MSVRVRDHAIGPRQGHGFEEPRLIMDVRRRALEWIERYLGAS